MPALLKAFLEQVMRPGIALEYRERGFPRGLFAERSARLVVMLVRLKPLSAAALVLQPEFIATHSSLPMAAAGALLVTPPPQRPGEDMRGIGRTRPHQAPQQPWAFSPRA
jgi:Flavodoxin-like fold